MDMMLVPGEKIVIHIQSQTNPEHTKSMHSRVINMDTEYYYIRYPVMNGVEYPLRTDQTLQVIFYRQSGMFSFSAKIIKKIKDNQQDYYQIAAVSELNRTERRAHIRIYLSIEGSIRSLENDKSCDMTIHNLSSGGIQAVCEQPFYRGERIECSFVLDHHHVKTTAQIIRVRRLKDEKLYEMGVQFYDVREEYQNLIDEYIFRKKTGKGKQGEKPSDEH